MQTYSASQTCAGPFMQAYAMFTGRLLLAEQVHETPCCVNTVQMVIASITNVHTTSDASMAVAHWQKLC